MAKRYKLTQFALWLASEIDALGITKQQFCDEANIPWACCFDTTQLNNIQKSQHISRSAKHWPNTIKHLQRDMLLQESTK